MNRSTATLVLLVGPPVVGTGLGVWNHQQIERCHAEYDDGPTVAVDCEDAFTGMVPLVSTLCVAVGVVGSGAVLFRRRG